MYRNIHKLEKQIKSWVLKLHKPVYEIWSHSKISWVQQDNESSAYLDKSNTENVTVANAGKHEQKFWKQRKTSGFFHFLWTHLVTYIIRDAEVAVPLVQSPITALVYCS